MKLRENSLYMRFSTHHDVVDDATHVELLERLQEWNGRPFALYQNLGDKGRPRELTAQLLLDELHSRVGEGLHGKLRFRVWSETGTPIRSFEFNAGAHPYSGRFVTMVDIRYEREWMERNRKISPDNFVERFEEVASLLHPFQGHAHDTDDNSIQNIGSASLLRRGYGLEVTEPIDLASNPGREVSRAGHRYVVNWLTLFGPEMVEHLGPQRFEDLPGELRELDIDPNARKTLGEQVAEEMGDHREKTGKWLLLRLAHDPLSFDDPEIRGKQKTIKERLQLEKIAADERWPWGYWQSKD